MAARIEHDRTVRETQITQTAAAAEQRRSQLPAVRMRVLIRGEVRRQQELGRRLAGACRRITSSDKEGHRGD